MSQRSVRRLWCALLLLACAAGSGCATGSVNLWPVYFHEVRQVQTPQGPRTVSSTDVLYPFFTRESGPDETWYAVRPIYNYQPGPEEGRRRVQFIWPLGLYFTDGREVTQFRLFPLWDYIKSWSDRRQRYSVHGHVLQLIRYGSDADFGPYFAVIPLGGITHKVIGDTWSFLLFPLYSHYRQGSYVRDDFPWPILGYGRTPDGSKVMYRAFPFYVYQRNHNKLGLYVRQDVIWPLVRWGMVDKGGRYYDRMYVAAPFFSMRRTLDRQDKLVAYQASVLGVSFGNDTREKKPESGWGALWSLVRSHQEPGREDFRIFPFYWRTTYTRQGDAERTWVRKRILWPILWFDNDQFDPDVTKKAILVVPFYWHYTDLLHHPDAPDSAARRITLWPLATWEQEAEGGRHFYLLSHGWRDAGQGFKRNYRAFFDWFQYHSGAGVKETRVLSRLYRHRRGPDGRYLSVMSLFTYDSTGEVVGEQDKYVSALFGLVKCSWTQQGRRWRVLYIPLG